MRPGTGARKCERGSHVEIRIGIANTGRELNFETNESSADVKQTIAGALDTGATHITLADNKRNNYIVPTASLAYIELGTEESRRVGFVA
jgi:hypothetical protein